MSVLRNAPAIQPAPLHTANLVEQHCISIAVPAPLPSADRWDTVMEKFWRGLEEDARVWAEDECIDIVTERTFRFDGDQQMSHLCVEWTVLVGQGTEPIDPTAVADNADYPPWLWTTRWHTWLDCFRLLDRPVLACLPGGNVAPLKRPGKKK